MKRWQFWRIPNGDGSAWGCRLRLGRVEIGGRLYRHAYGERSPDRWVLQPVIVYDRKRASS